MFDKIIKINENKKNNFLLEDNGNFIITLREIKINKDKINDIEEKLYSSICKEDNERDWIIIKNVQKILENIVNEMIYKDIYLLTENNTPWVTINMDSLYLTNLDHIKYNNKETEKILPRSKENNRKKIINCNIIISTLHRVEGIYLINKKKECEEFEIKEKIKFTKGYMICLKPELINIMKKYEYYKKTISKEKILINSKEKMTVKEFLRNENYSNPIWIKNDNITDIEINNIKLNENCLEDKVLVKDFIKNINFLNSIKFTINKNIFNDIKEIIENMDIINNIYINKNKLIENIYRIGDKEESLDISNGLKELDIRKMINSASMFEIIKKQVEKFDYFYINNAYDSRLRIYAQTWPINYQLNHIIRSCIKILDSYDIYEINKKFNENKYIINNYIKCNDSLINKIEKKDLIILEKIIDKRMKWDKEDLIKKECLLNVLTRLSPSNLKIKDKVKFSLNIYEKFMNDDIKLNIVEWENTLKIKKSKCIYIISLKECLKNIENNDFSESFWLDASSNAVQLIALRMGCKNEKLLMLTNIIDNETEYENIYDYVTEKIKELNHEELINRLESKINKDDINNMRDKEDTKYLIMPACYGMGKYKNRINIEEKLYNNKKWIELNKKDKNKISDYFWNKTFEILKEIDFDLDGYKKICKKMKNYDAFIWENDVGLKIAPINTMKSNRQNLLKKENELKMKIKENKNENNIIKLERIRELIKKDEKNFWKRTMVRIKINNEKNIFIRIPTDKKILDKRMTMQALTPNTIHGYDASIMFLCIMICREIGIKIMVIHDCIGCAIINIPLVKKIFKIANIEILNRCINKKPFPLEKFKITKEELNVLKIKILESTNFFR